MESTRLPSMLIRIFGLLIILACIPGNQSCKPEAKTGYEWVLYLQQETGEEIKITTLPQDLTQPFSESYNSDHLSVSVDIAPKEGYVGLNCSVTANVPTKIFFSLRCEYDTTLFEAINFNGKVDSAEVFRQSPHDVDAWIVTTIAMQAMPMVAVQNDKECIVALSDAPFNYENFTSQAFYPKKGLIALNSGDDASTPGLQPDKSEELDLDYNADKTQRFSPGKVLPYYHKVDQQHMHRFEAILFKTPATQLNAIRKELTSKAAHHFSEGKYEDYFGALAFTSAYFNLRKNDSGKSAYWVIPAVEYGNTQYGRDAFWIATMLPPEYAAECIKSELAEVNHFAEYPLFAIIWAYRAIKEGNSIDLKLVQAYVDAVEQRVANNAYYSYWEGDGRLDFQYWGDVIAFEKDDLIAYNQGLFAVAMAMAKELGLQIKSDPKAASEIYQGLFNEEYGFLPVSRQKLILSPDALLPDLLSQIYLNKKLLPSDKVRQHYDRMVKYARTDFGFKIVSTPQGEYLPAEMYDIPGYQSQVNREKMPDGQYFRGGSYFLYDNLFLIDAYMHGIEGAEDLLKWRVGLDFSTGATTYETLNTLDGEPWKPNMGWNVAVYAFWRRLIDEGKADDGLLKHINGIVKE